MQAKKLNSLNKPKLIISSFDDINNPYYGGGGAWVVHNIGKRLSGTFDVTVLTGNFPGAKNVKVENIYYKRIGLSFLGAKPGQLLYSIILPFYVIKESYDLWLESFTPPFSAGFLPLLTSKPVIGFVQMLASEDMQRKYKLPFKIVENLGLKTYKYFIVSTENSKNKISEINKKAKTYVFPVGIESLPKVISGNKFIKDSNKKYILYIGRIEFNQKGLDLLVSAYDLISKKTECNLYIAGSGNSGDLHKLKELIVKLNLQDRIKLLGRVSGLKKEVLFRQSSLIIIPSRFETFCLVALEAFSFRKPVIGFNIAGLSWIPKNCMIKVKPFSCEQLSRKMLEVLDNQGLQDSLSENGEKEVRKYLWDNLVYSYQKVFQEVIRYAK